ncbi:hypothetical protein C7402_111147 [Paraburkholderia unamae]|uniref:Uncharacterized protein n=2 Tax=Paraburkholderia unamae TaxID=219649 RepID=A0ABX5KP28_9BURK|nr:hypothetical protein C7402_111147 [Paraburkholderia unamae]
MVASIIDAFSHTPEAPEDRAAQINLALDAGDAVMAASIVFDHARDLRIPFTALDSGASGLFPYPDLAPFGNQGLEQFMEALGHLGLKLTVSPAGN